MNDILSLSKEYSNVINIVISKYLYKAKMVGLEYDDLYQEALIALSIANNRFDKTIKFDSYLSNLLDNRIKDILKKENIYSKLILNEAVSLDEYINENETLYNKISTNNYIPENECVTKELDEEIKNKLAVFEYKVYELKKEGKSNKDISYILDSSIKSIENCIIRIKGKIKTLV